MSTPVLLYSQSENQNSSFNNKTKKDMAYPLHLDYTTEQVPELILNFKHLQYLKLSGYCCFELVPLLKLPPSVTLDLRGCTIEDAKMIE